jgi:ribonuclease J
MNQYRKSDKTQRDMKEDTPSPRGVLRPKQAHDSTPKKKNGKKSHAPALRIVPLGGLREIGKNMTVFEYGDDIIIIDCGIAFPDDNMPGVDTIIPDFTYLRENKEKIRGLIITHGHEDHIGAIPWFLQEFDVPVYATPLTMKLIELKLDDFRPKVKSNKLQVVRAGESLTIGPFTFDFIHINHSIADAVSIAIHTPVGIIFYTGDFKIDFTPTSDVPHADLGKIAALGNEGVLLLISESTNVELPGSSLSEREVGKTFDNIFHQATGRVIVAMFSSNVFRLQQAISTAERFGRKVLILGRSIQNVFEAADRLAYLTYRPDTIIQINELDQYPPEKIVIIATGSQGEPMSALTRLAYSEHKLAEIIPGDTVILSSSMIPGNEAAIYNVINELFMRGANVIYESLSAVHASGHACQDELKLMLALTRPTYFVPAHGEYRMLYQHAELASLMGIPNDHIAILQNGDVLEFSEDGMEFAGYTEAAGVLIDGSGMGDVDELVLSDRLRLANDGVVSVMLVIDRLSNRLYGTPIVKASGFTYQSDMKKMITSCQDTVEDMAERLFKKKKPLDRAMTPDSVSKEVQKVLYEHTRRRPLVMTSVTVI